MKIAVVGCGNIADVHVPFILNQKNVEIVAVCDAKEERAKITARKYDIKDYYSDYDKMLDKEKPDVVHVLTPVQTHAVLVVKALKSGCHVFVEKAMCLNKKEASEIIETARGYSRKVCVDHTLLFDPLFKRTREILKTGVLGEIVHIEALVCDDHLKKKKEGLARPWVDQLPGGILNELLPHPLYIIEDFLLAITLKYAHINRTAEGDIANLFAFFVATNTDASIRISLTEYPIQQSVTFHCTNGIICVDYRNLTLTVKRNVKLPGPLHRLYSNLSQAGQILGETLKTGWGVVRGKVKAYSGLQCLINQFYQSINLDKPSPVSEYDGAKIVQMMNDIWKCLTDYYDVDNKISTDNKFVTKQTPSISVNRDKVKTLVTGATGFVGSYLTNRLVEDGKVVRVLCRRSSDLSKLPKEGIEIVYGDMRDTDSLNEATKGIELIYHCTATIKGKWIDFFEGTVEGTKCLFEAALKNNVQKVVYISSTGIFNTAKFSNKAVINENSELEENPDKRGLYIKAKLEAEKITKEYMSDNRLNITIIRPGIVYGNGGRKYISDAGYLLNQKLVIVPGSKNRLLHLVYVENLVDAIILAGQKNKTNGEIYNIVDHNQPTVSQYLNKYKKITSIKPFVIYVPLFLFDFSFWILRIPFKMILRMSFPDISYRLHCLTHNKYDLSKAESKLNWYSKVPLDEALKKTFIS